MTQVAICLVILQRMRLSGTVMEIWRLNYRYQLAVPNVRP